MKHLIFLTHLFTEQLYLRIIFLLGFPKVELEDPLENVGVKLVRQAGARTNDLAGDGCTTSIILAQGLISEGVKVCMNLSMLFLSIPLSLFKLFAPFSL